MHGFNTSRTSPSPRGFSGTSVRPLRGTFIRCIWHISRYIRSCSQEAQLAELRQSTGLDGVTCKVQIGRVQTAKAGKRLGVASQWPCACKGAAAHLPAGTRSVRPTAGVWPTAVQRNLRASAEQSWLRCYRLFADRSQDADSGRTDEISSALRLLQPRRRALDQPAHDHLLGWRVGREQTYR
eukprot:183170-Chlamydomonas_euryale.AAC.3